MLRPGGKRIPQPRDSERIPPSQVWDDSLKVTIKIANVFKQLRNFDPSR